MNGYAFGANPGQMPPPQRQPNNTGAQVGGHLGGLIGVLLGQGNPTAAAGGRMAGNWLGSQFDDQIDPAALAAVQARQNGGF